MDKFELKVLQLVGIAIVVMIFGVLVSTDKSNVPECVPYGDVYKEAKVVELDSNLYQIFYVASMWNFEPYDVFIPVGSEVDIYLTSKDVVHGLLIADKNVNLMATYGAVNKTTVKFDKPGIYDVVCHEYCGSSHHAMKAQIVVN